MKKHKQPKEINQLIKQAKKNPIIKELLFATGWIKKK